MPFEIGGELAQGQQILLRDVRRLRPRGIQDWRCVALREYEAIGAWMLRLHRVVSVLRKKQCRDDVSRRTTRRWMAAAGLGRRADRFDPEPRGDVVECSLQHGAVSIANGERTLEWLFGQGPANRV